MRSHELAFFVRKGEEGVRSTKKYFLSLFMKVIFHILGCTEKMKFPVHQ